MKDNIRAESETPYPAAPQTNQHAGLRKQIAIGIVVVSVVGIDWIDWCCRLDGGCAVAGWGFADRGAMSGEAGIGSYCLH